MTETTLLLRDLVRLPSVNPMGRDLPEGIIFEHRVTAYLEKYFQSLGVPYERQAIALGRDNILAYYRNAHARRTLLLEVHQDTVPVDNMTIDPFGGVIENGRLSGRGACDVKGGMAAMLCAFARLVRDQPAQAANVILACTVDEEHTFLGVQELVKRKVKADMAIVAEPTGLNIVHAHKGVVRWTVEVPGRSCHSSSPEKGINAVYRMGKLLASIEAYAEMLQTSVMDPILGPATLSVGRIEGGTSVNTVPDFCRVEIDRRLLPGETVEGAASAFRDALAQDSRVDFPFTCSPPWLGNPPLASAGSEQLVQRLGIEINKVRGNHLVHVVPYGTDASTLAEAGIPSVVFGPGDIAFAHTRNESVPLDEIETASEILYRFACSLD